MEFTLFVSVVVLLMVGGLILFIYKVWREENPRKNKAAEKTETPDTNEGARSEIK